MKKYLYLTVLALFFFNAYSQDLKKKHTTDGDKKESFFVLKSDRNIKHGDYELKLWGQIVQKGQFDRGKKTGTWFFYSQTGEMEFAYNYDTDSIVPVNHTSIKLPFYTEGSAVFWYLISANINYPADAREAGIKGMVIISFTVDTDGKAKDFSVDAGCGNLSLNNEALRVVKIAATEHYWLPWVNDKGENEKTDFFFPVSFRLSK